ncbi:SdiA-regulated domain-containing protein [Flavobacterium sp. WC2430]|uniref:SdiA-regulated domain-containing protein n=1 Tax=Flavobacterium sp. WC2430 TaxID=3234137 RepID=UPI0034671DDA
MKNYFLFFSVGFFLFSCQQDSGLLVPLYKLPSKLKEVSGISYSPQSHLVWAIEDSGNKNKIYGIDTSGNVVNSVTIKKAKNIDWEDITTDQEGNFYIGDFGNNDNTRQDLCIYKVPKYALESKVAQTLYKVSFSYPEQNEFPPKKKELLFDVESFFELKGNFYLFTKNRSKGFDGTTLLYRIPNKEGFHQAKLLGKYKTGNDFDNYAITSAAISPDQSKVVLLSHSRIWLFENFKEDDFFSGKMSEFNLKHNSQKEGICFKDNDKLLIVDEKTKGNGGMVYEVSINKLKLKSKS